MMKSLFSFRLSLIGYLVIAGISATIGTLAYQDFTRPAGSGAIQVESSNTPS